METPDKESIIAALIREEEFLTKIADEQKQALSRIKSLRDKLTSLKTTEQVRESPAQLIKSTFSLKTSENKVALFRSLFRGREDVFPRLWISRAGRKGYAPACSNDWTANVCGKTRTPPIKCGECANRKFLPVTDQIILDHLQGRHVIGVYPMLENDSCWFLAADFDKETWMDDIAAFRKTCQSMGIPIAVERSRSGNGAHAWFFFTEIISANTARAMGCFLITETMSNRHQLSMESYDRLFPSQDTLPKGGFGNLIALPLQHEPRQKNNTVFLDENFKPYEDLALWALSFGRSHRLIIRHLEKTSDPIRASRHAVNALTVMVAGLIAVAVANEEVIAHPRGQTSFALSLLLCGGPILFLSAQGWYLWAVPSVRSQLHVIGGMVLLFVGLATLAVPPYVALLLVGASVLTIAVLAR